MYGNLDEHDTARYEKAFGRKIHNGKSAKWLLSSRLQKFIILYSINQQHLGENLGVFVYVFLIWYEQTWTIIIRYKQLCLNTISYELIWTVLLNNEQKGEEKMELTMAEILVLDLLYNNTKSPCINRITAMSIYDLDAMGAVSRSRQTIQRIMCSLVKKELVKEGGKNGSAKTYYITQKGIEQFDILLSENL